MPRKSLKSDQPLRALLDASPRPVYAIDADRRIVYCNAALQRWLNLPFASIIGRLVEYHSESTQPSSAPSDLAGPLTGLCPPPSAITGDTAEGTVACLDAAGHLVHRRAQFLPLDDPMSTSSSVKYSDPSCSLVAFLSPADLSPQELAIELSDDPNSDELHRAIRHFRRSQSQRYAADSLLGQSSAAAKLRSQVAFAATSDANVLILGRSGTGRAHVARAIHYHRDPAQRLVIITAETANDDSLRRALDLLTAARSADRPPTLLVEHAQHLSPTHQTQIAEAFRRGRASARLMATLDSDRAATDALVPPFRDLVSTLTIHVPRLIERLDDLPILTQTFLESANRDDPHQVGGIRSDALDLLALYSWPGELDELRKFIAAAHHATNANEIRPTDLPAVIHHAAQAAALPPRKRQAIVLDNLLAEIETEVIQRALSQAKGNKTEAAELLGLTRPRLYRRMQQLGLITAEPESEELPTFRPVVDNRDSQLPDFQEIDAEDGQP